MAPHDFLNKELVQAFSFGGLKDSIDAHELGTRDYASERGRFKDLKEGRIRARLLSNTFELVEEEAGERA